MKIVITITLPRKPSDLAKNVIETLLLDLHDDIAHVGVNPTTTIEITSEPIVLTEKDVKP